MRVQIRPVGVNSRRARHNIVWNAGIIHASGMVLSFVGKDDFLLVG